MLALIKQFVSRKTAFDERLRPIKFLLREEDLRLLLCDIGVGLVEATLCLLNLRLGLFERSFDVARVHACDDLAGHNIVTFVDE